MGMVQEDTPIAGKTIGELYRQLHQYDFEIIVVMRREHVLLPHPDTVLQAMDRVIMIISPAAGDQLAKYIAPIPPVQESGVQAPASDAAA